MLVERVEVMRTKYERRQTGGGRAVRSDVSLSTKIRHHDNQTALQAPASDWHDALWPRPWILHAHVFHDSTNEWCCNETHTVRHACFQQRC